MKRKIVVSHEFVLPDGVHENSTEEEVQKYYEEMLDEILVREDFKVSIIYF